MANLRSLMATFKLLNAFDISYDVVNFTGLELVSMAYTCFVLPDFLLGLEEELLLLMMSTLDSAYYIHNIYSEER